MPSDKTIRVGNFILPTPQDWDIASLIVVGPPEDQDSAAGGQAFQQNVVVVSEPVERGETAESYVQKQTAKLKEQKALYAAPGQLEKVKLTGDRSAAVFEHVVLGPNGERVRQMQLVSLHDGRMHALIASHLDGPRFAAHRAGMKKLLTGVRVSAGGFELLIDAGWNIASLIMVGPPEGATAAGPGAPATGGSANVPAAPGGAGFQQNIVVVSEPVAAEETADTYVQKQTAKLKEQKALHASPGQLEKLSLSNGRSAALFEHVVLGPNGERVRQMQLVALHQGHMHALIASHLDGPRFAAHRTGLRKILTGVVLP